MANILTAGTGTTISPMSTNETISISAAGGSSISSYIQSASVSGNTLTLTPVTDGTVGTAITFTGGSSGGGLATTQVLDTGVGITTVNQWHATAYTIPSGGWLMLQFGATGTGTNRSHSYEWHIFRAEDLRSLSSSSLGSSATNTQHSSYAVRATNINGTTHNVALGRTSTNQLLISSTSTGNSFYNLRIRTIDSGGGGGSSITNYLTGITQSLVDGVPGLRTVTVTGKAGPDNTISNFYAPSNFIASAVVLENTLTLVPVFDGAAGEAITFSGGTDTYIKDITDNNALDLFEYTPVTGGTEGSEVRVWKAPISYIRNASINSDGDLTLVKRTRTGDISTDTNVVFQHGFETTELFSGDIAINNTNFTTVGTVIVPATGFGILNFGDLGGTANFKTGAWVMVSFAQIRALDAGGTSTNRQSNGQLILEGVLPNGNDAYIGRTATNQLLIATDNASWDIEPLIVHSISSTTSTQSGGTPLNYLTTAAVSGGNLILNRVVGGIAGTPLTFSGGAGVTDYVRAVTIAGDTNIATFDIVGGGADVVYDPLTSFRPTGHSSSFQYNIGASGGVSNDNSVSFGINNIVASQNSAVIGGQSNTATANFNFAGIFAGFSNTVSGINSVIVGGENNHIENIGSASPNNSVILVGSNNTIHGAFASILGGGTNTISVTNSHNDSISSSIIASFSSEIASSARSVILGGTSMYVKRAESVLVGTLGMIGHPNTVFGVAQGSIAPTTTEKAAEEDVGLVFKVRHDGSAISRNGFFTETDDGTLLEVGTGGGGLRGVEYTTISNPFHNEPPSADAATTGIRYIISGTPTGAFANQAHKIAERITAGNTATNFRFTTPSVNQIEFMVHDSDDNLAGFIGRWLYNGSSWIRITSGVSNSVSLDSTTDAVFGLSNTVSENSDYSFISGRNNRISTTVGASVMGRELIVRDNAEEYTTLVGRYGVMAEGGILFAVADSGGALSQDEITGNENVGILFQVGTDGSVVANSYFIDNGDGTRQQLGTDSPQVEANKEAIDIINGDVVIHGDYVQTERFNTFSTYSGRIFGLESSPNGHLFAAFNPGSGILNGSSTAIPVVMDVNTREIIATVTGAVNSQGFAVNDTHFYFKRQNHIFVTDHTGIHVQTGSFSTLTDVNQITANNEYIWFVRYHSDTVSIARTALGSNGVPVSGTPTFNSIQTIIPSNAETDPRTGTPIADISVFGTRLYLTVHLETTGDTDPAYMVIVLIANSFDEVSADNFTLDSRLFADGVTGFIHNDQHQYISQEYYITSFSENDSNLSLPSVQEEAQALVRENKPILQVPEVPIFTDISDNGEPDDSLGLNGQTYGDLETLFVYRKIISSWERIAGRLATLDDVGRFFRRFGSNEIETVLFENHPTYGTSNVVNGHVEPMVITVGDSENNAIEHGFESRGFRRNEDTDEFATGTLSPNITRVRNIVAIKGIGAGNSHLRILITVRGRITRPTGVRFKSGLYRDRTLNIATYEYDSTTNMTRFTSTQDSLINDIFNESSVEFSIETSSGDQRIADDNFGTVTHENAYVPTSGEVSRFRVLDNAQYQAITTKDANTLYLVEGTGVYIGDTRVANN